MDVRERNANKCQAIREEMDLEVYWEHELVFCEVFFYQNFKALINYIPVMLALKHFLIIPSTLVPLI